MTNRIPDERYHDELLMLARAITSIRQCKALVDSYSKLQDYEQKEKMLLSSLLKTIFMQEEERGGNHER